MKKLVCVAVLVAAVAVTGRLVAEDKDKPKRNIEVVMQKAHKEGGKNSLRARVLAGKASKEDLNLLVELYTDLSKNTPKKGDKTLWKKKTTEILAAAQKVKAAPTDTAALRALNKATACMACHDVFKEDE
jgi:hypothetical protein